MLSLPVIADLNSTCEVPITPYNGHVEVIYGEPGKPGSVIEFSCAVGSILQGDALLTCHFNGEWDREPPTCTSLY